MTVAYLNGRFIPFAEASLPLHDAGFVSGATVVDNARTYGRRLFRWADHLARFRRDCAACYVPLAATDDELTAIATELVARNGVLLPADGELQVVTFATPGPLGFYVGEPTNGPPTLGMVTYPVPARYARFAEEGVVLAVAGTQTTQAEDLLPPRVKHRSRMLWHVAERTVRGWADADAVPAVETQDGVLDTPIGGVFSVALGAVYFPPDGAALDSISLRVAAELLGRLGVPVRKEPGVSIARLAGGAATELILCGSGCGPVGVRGFARGPGQSRAFPVAGPVLTRLRAAWAEEVAAGGG
ncbi:aminotransferase class IV [Urbifossiella limnaea]|uniref:Branched-chain amino acid aminotransferase n=1 Tax=Urbifossiella limnaea TaxID=2528023 RepID=A0A517Y121_9BACT|nr:aminotransferase class IV [Urbifossiella limnaea]QDU23418.1 branched-chain amino acid aminotransferase [Urbifossiella limnaea]